MEQQLAALRSEIATSLGELSQKTDATNVVLEARTEVLAALSKQMSEMSDGVKARTEELFRETEVGFVAESERTTRLVEELRVAIDSVDRDQLVEVAEKLLEQDRRDEERIKFVMQSLKPDIEKLQHETWDLSQRFQREGAWARDQFSGMSSRIESAAPGLRSGDDPSRSGGRASRIKIPDPRAWKLETLKGSRTTASGERSSTFRLDASG